MTWLTQPNPCPGLFYGTFALDGLLLRLRLSGGYLNRRQGETIATLLEQWDLERIQVTNRANLQIRSVPKAPSLEVYQRLQAQGLASHNPHLDHLRNLMTSPTAGIDSQELIDTRPLIQALDAYIQSHPQLSALPPKFSIGIDGGGEVGIGLRSILPWEHRPNELQFSAVRLDDGIYLHLPLGNDTQVFIAPENCVPLVAALTKVYLDYVNIQQSAKKPRLKQILEDWGGDFYLEQVKKSLSCPLVEISGVALPSTGGYGYLGVHPQKQMGLSYLGVSLPLGQLTAKQLREIIKLLEKFGLEDLRLTPWQSILIPNIPNLQVGDFCEHLSYLGLSASCTQADASIVACVGKSGCSSALTYTQNHARELSEYLHHHVTLERPVNIHLTGCAKLCAQPSPAQITLLGIEIDQDGESVEGYSVYLGDKHLGDWPVTRLPFLVQKLLS